MISDSLERLDLDIQSQRDAKGKVKREIISLERSQILDAW